MIFLPRQARDKHRESSQKSGVSLLRCVWQFCDIKVDQTNTSSNRPGGINNKGVVRKTVLFEPFIYKNDLFTKTGSGQT